MTGLVIATLDADTGAFMGLAMLASALCVLWLIVFLAVEVSGRQRWRRPLLTLFRVLIALTAIAYGGLFVSA